LHGEHSSSAEDSGSDDESADPTPGAPSREERKAHKKIVKEAARERRKTKIPKHVKKRATKHK
jgi:RIO kinase 1